MISYIHKEKQSSHTLDLNVEIIWSYKKGEVLLWII